MAHYSNEPSEEWDHFEQKSISKNLPVLISFMHYPRPMIYGSLSHADKRLMVSTSLSLKRGSTKMTQSSPDAMAKTRSEFQGVFEIPAVLQ
jgi:hypothetical protein